MRVGELDRAVPICAPAVNHSGTQFWKEFVEDGAHVQGVTLFGVEVPIAMWVFGLAEKFGWFASSGFLFKRRYRKLDSS